jgi:exopolysaccharide biosynthesis WecB/TagA/CpsF family protein
MISSLDDFDLARFLPVASTFGKDRYGFVVTPNVDHLIRCYEDPKFRGLYAAASFVLMDSRFAARIIRLVKGVQLPICTGSDLTEALLSSVIQPDDRIVLIGATNEQARLVAQKYGLRDLRHHNPPMGFIRDAAAVESCLEFVEKNGPFRFCFLAVGSPQQEVVAHALQTRGIARGLALCVGASLDFLTGAEQRAPRWMQQAGVEWLYRLLQNPRRLARRYLVRGPQFFLQLPRWSFLLRKPAASYRASSVE